MNVSDFTTYLKHLLQELQHADTLELACAVGAPLVGLLVGLQIKRHLVNREQKGWSATLLDYLTPLLSPALALGLTTLAITCFHASDMENTILVYMLKLCTAWFAVALVYVMSRKRTAGWFIALVVIPITLLHLFDLWDVTTEALESVKFELGNIQLNLYLVCRGVVLILLLQWLTSFTVTIVDQRLNKVHNLRASNRTLIMKLFQIVLYCFVFLFAMQLLGISLTTLGVFGGALGVGLGFGLQKIASNFISGIILLFEKSIEIGDLIELQDGTLGYVRQTYARYTRLEMTNGKEMFIPNEEFISQRIISWTHSNNKAQVEIVLSVGYDTDIPFARKLMEDAANAHPSRLPGSDSKSYMTAFGDSGIELRVQFWVRDINAGRQAPKSDIMQAILLAFRQNEISLPFPQREVRILNQQPAVEPALVERPSPVAKAKATTKKPVLKKKTVKLKDMP